MSEGDVDVKKTRLQVALRLRATDEPGIVTNEKRLIYIKDPNKGHTSEFVFDQVFDQKVTQNDVFENVGVPLVEHVLQGYNACCFAYGQTGSGKTYSMFGDQQGEWENRGLIPRVAETLFNGGKDVAAGGRVRFLFFVSFLEIYMEQVRDLGKASRALLPASQRAPGQPKGSRPASARDDGWEYARENLDILEDPSGKTLVKDLTYIEVKAVEDIMTVLKAGYSLRQTASTAQNDVSSRSHSVFTIYTVQYPSEGHHGQPITGQLNMIDLAGSERLKKSHSSDLRLQEAKAINTSLSALGKVVMSLSQEGDRSHVPFRDSKLTRILKDSLSGNSYTTLLANLNPTRNNYEECLNTLQFALRCSSISTVPHVNIVTMGTAQDKVIEELTAKISQMTEEIEYLHAHYQKLIEEIAGPGYTLDMGPIEREDGKEHDSVPLKDLGSVEVGGEEQRQTRVSSGRPSSTKTRPQSPRWNRRSATNMRMMEAQKKSLEQNLEAHKNLIREYEERVRRKKNEFDDLRDRMMRGEQQYRDEMRRLRARLKETQEKASDETQALRNKIDEQQLLYETETGRLAANCEKLRSQLSEFTSSVSEMGSSRAREAELAHQRTMRQREEFESRYKEMVNSAETERLRELEIMRQQNVHFLAKKDEEIKQLNLKLDASESESVAMVSQMKEENVYLHQYCEKLWYVLRKVEAGEYPMQIVRGMRSIKIPPKDKPAGMDTARLERLRSSIERADKFISHSDAIEHYRPHLSIETRSHGTTTDQATSLTEHDSPRTMGAASVADSAECPPPNQDRDIIQSKDVEAADVEVGTDTSEFPRAACEFSNPLEKEIRENIEAAVLSELQSHTTVEYIHQLEEDIQKYRKQLQEERKRNHNLVVSLRSAQRREETAGRRTYRPSPKSDKIRMDRPNSSPITRSGGWTIPGYSFC